MTRLNNRQNDCIRDVKITKGYTKYAEGSVLIEMGDTKVLCNATVEEKIPPFKKDSGEGWITAEYSMLPRSTLTRNNRDIAKLKQNQRSVEIQRLIGRSLRAAINFKALGERTILIDCDVLQADSGTRTASITGSFIALALACKKLVKNGIIEKNPIEKYIAAVSVGIVGGDLMLDLCYEEDSNAEVDMNVVMTEKGDFVELQGTGENGTFSVEDLTGLTEIAKKGIDELIKIQKDAIDEF